MTAARCLWAGALALLALSLALPAVEGPGFPSQSGLDILRQGAGAWRDGIVAWYANPMLGAAVVIGIVAGQRRLPGLVALALAAIGLLLALSSFTAGPAAASAGRRVPEFHFAFGFYVWLLAFPTGVLAAVYGLSGRTLYKGVVGSPAAEGPAKRPRPGPARD